MRSRRIALASVTAAGLLCAGAHDAVQAQDRNAKTPSEVQGTDWAPLANSHLEGMPHDRASERTKQQTPLDIPVLDSAEDASGRIATYQPGGPTATVSNAFFQDLGSNGRTCFTCHQPQDGWALSAQTAAARFAASEGRDPLFRPVDGANCPTADVGTLVARLQAYSLLREKALIRIGLPIPDGAEFAVTQVADPYGCNTNPATGLTSPTSGIVSVYRRPLPAANLGFLSAIMWDGREPDLAHQAMDATLGHAQAPFPPTAEEQAQIVAFESGIFVAQAFDNAAHRLDAQGAKGGPVALAGALSDFFIGINDPLGQNPTKAPFDPTIFRLYDAWGLLPGKSDETQRRESIARGQRIFNTTPIRIIGVAGLNDALKLDVVPGFCGTCHDTPDVGNHSVKAPLDIGVGEAGAATPPALDIAGLPVFTLDCVSGPLAGRSYTVTDPGRALITGKCADIGKMKGPILRGLAARAPYFHNGSAATLAEVVEFYDRRFAIGLTEAEKRDLANFLAAL